MDEDQEMLPSTRKDWQDLGCGLMLGAVAAILGFGCAYIFGWTR